MYCRSSIRGKSLVLWFIFLPHNPPLHQGQLICQFLAGFIHPGLCIHCIASPSYRDCVLHSNSGRLLRRRSLYDSNENKKLVANWSKHHTGVWISPGMMPEPSSVRRVVIVYESIANWSSSYFMVNGYSLTSPVGILMYNTSKMAMKLQKQVRNCQKKKKTSFMSHVPENNSMENNSSAKCIMFRRGGMEIKDGRVKNNTCVWKSIGHFAIVVPSPVVGSGGVVEKSKKQRIGGLWSVVGVGCCCGLLMGICVIGIMRLLKKRKRLVKMETICEEDEALTSVRIQGIQIHRAGMIRTKPLETSESR